METALIASMIHLHDRRNAGHTDIGSAQHRQPILWADETTPAKLGCADYSDPHYLERLKAAGVEMGSGKVIAKPATAERRARKESKRNAQRERKRRGSLGGAEKAGQPGHTGVHGRQQQRA